LTLILTLTLILILIFLGRQEGVQGEPGTGRRFSGVRGVTGSPCGFDFAFDFDLDFGGGV
jgi:hypothetical protein